MKKTIIYVIMLLIATGSFSQQTKKTETFDRQYYLNKSKNQKTAAWVLLGGGTALIGTGFLLAGREEASIEAAGGGYLMVVTGTLAAIGSIPLFIASGRNKRNSMNASLSFKFEKAQIIQHTELGLYTYPAISIKLDL